MREVFVLKIVLDTTREENPASRSFSSLQAEHVGPWENAENQGL